LRRRLLKALVVWLVRTSWFKWFLAELSVELLNELSAKSHARLSIVDARLNCYRTEI